jgi:hypothetical protein
MQVLPSYEAKIESWQSEVAVFPKALARLKTTSRGLTT